MVNITTPQVISVYSPRGNGCWSAYISAGLARELSRRERVLLVSCSYDASILSTYRGDIFDWLRMEENKNITRKSCGQLDFHPYLIQVRLGEGLGYDRVIFNAPHSMALLPKLKSVSDKFVFTIIEDAINFLHAQQSLDYLQKDRKDVYVVVADCWSGNNGFAREKLTQPPLNKYTSSLIPQCRALEDEGYEKVLANGPVKRTIQMVREFLYDFEFAGLE